jgi:hypothetical protein
MENLRLSQLLRNGIKKRGGKTSNAHLLENSKHSVSFRFEYDNKKGKIMIHFDEQNESVEHAPKEHDTKEHAPNPHKESTPEKVEKKRRIGTGYTLSGASYPIYADK